MKHNYIFTFVLIIFTINSFAQTNWVVPDDKKELLAPSKFNDESVKLGQEIFNKTCVSCHGHPGKNDHSNIIPTPKDPASKEYQANSDGEMFYKITEGKAPMPSFKAILKSEDVWNVISYIRSFNKDYVQVVNKIDSNKNNVNEIYGKFIFNENNHLINIKLSEKKNEFLPVKGNKVSVFVKRYFGWLQIDESKTSDNNGLSTFEYPKNLPGDKIGNINFKVTIANADGTDAILIDTIIKTSIIANQNKLLDNRAMWNVRSKAPIWLILAYSIAVIVSWGIIFYIISLLLKIKKSGYKIKK